MQQNFLHVFDNATVAFEVLNDTNKSIVEVHQSWRRFVGCASINNTLLISVFSPGVWHEEDQASSLHSPHHQRKSPISWIETLYIVLWISIAFKKFTVLMFLKSRLHPLKQMLSSSVLAEIARKTGWHTNCTGAYRYNENHFLLACRKERTLYQCRYCLWEQLVLPLGQQGFRL